MNSSDSKSVGKTDSSDSLGAASNGAATAADPASAKDPAEDYEAMEAEQAGQTPMPSDNESEEEVGLSAQQLVREYNRFMEDHKEIRMNQEQKLNSLTK